MARRARAPLRALVDLVAARWPGMNAEEAVKAGRVVVDGRIVTNPASRARQDAAIVTRHHDGALRGETKLTAALRMFDVAVRSRVVLDLGAAAGGFTRVLLRHGAARVYAVDVGFGQLVGSLRQHPAVVNLERTNLAQLDPELVPATIDVATADLSYISLTRAMPQLNGRVVFAADADLVALVKPQFELGLPRPPTEVQELARAVDAARSGVEHAGWTVVKTAKCPVRGRHGAVEFLLNAVRRPADQTGTTCQAGEPQWS